MCLAVSAAVAAARLFKVQRVSLFLIEILLYKVYYILFLEEESVPWFSRHTHTFTYLWAENAFSCFFFHMYKKANNVTIRIYYVLLRSGIHGGSDHVLVTRYILKRKNIEIFFWPTTWLICSPYHAYLVWYLFSSLF